MIKLILFIILLCISINFIIYYMNIDIMYKPKEKVEKKDNDIIEIINELDSSINILNEIKNI
jgi:hypothetical protein